MNDPEFDPYLPPRAPVGFPKQKSGSTEGIDGNPWLTVWTQPRATIRGIVESDPTKNVLLLSAIYGIATTINNAMSKNGGDALSMPALIAVFLIGGLIGGLLWNVVWGAIMLWTGRWLGGQATYTETRAALAWGAVPYTVILVLSCGMMIVFGLDLFRSVDIETVPLLPVALIGLGLVQVVLGIWSAVLMIKCLAEVHQYSAWRSFGAMILGGFLVGGIVVLIVLAVVIPFSVMKAGG